jgi:hypothetical protein
LLSIPYNTFLKFHSVSTKDIQRTANCQIDTAIAQVLDMVQILEISSATSVCDWYAAPLRQFLHQLLINTFLQTLVICRVNQEFGAVWFEGFDGSL